MKKKLIILIVLILLITGCKKDEILTKENNELFMIGHTFDDGRHISFTFDVPYYDGYLSDLLVNDEMKIDEFISSLSFVSLANDGGSKLYKYNKTDKIFGSDNFYVLVCNSIDGIKDIFVSKNMDSLGDKCTIKIDDLKGVSMTIKDDTLTKEGATIIITDTSSRDNIYGEWYRIDKFHDGKWIELDVILDGNYGFNSIGYSVKNDNKLELDINWKWLYGELSSGKYRLVKDTSYSGEGTIHYITAEFWID